MSKEFLGEAAIARLIELTKREFGKYPKREEVSTALDEGLNIVKITNNLFDVSKVSGYDVDISTSTIHAVVEDGLGRTFVDLGKMSDYCPEMVAGKSYVFSADCDASFGTLTLWLPNGNWIYDGETFSPTENDLKSNVRFSVNGTDESLNGTKYSISRIMINEGTEALPFEPYYEKVSIKQSVKELQAEVGDISTALDELHAYAQTLVNGGAAE